MQARYRLDERGGILITAIGALLVLSALAMGFAGRMSLETRMVALREADLRAYCAADAGIKTGIHELSKDDSRGRDSANEAWFDNPAAFKDEDDESE